jgi:hypothetical protein
MRIRAGLVAVLLLAALVPGALAAKPVCRIVQDARGDAEYNGVPGDDGDDLISADLASDGKQLTAIWRLAALKTPNPSAPLGQDFMAYFQAPGTQTRLFVFATTATTPPTFEYGSVEPGTPTPQIRPRGTAKGQLDVVRGEVRLTMATRGLAGTGATFRKGGRLRSIQVFSGRRITPAALSLLGVTPNHLSFDDADGSVYVIGTPSCARPVL